LGGRTEPGNVTDPDCRDDVVLLTGGTSGIGRAAAVRLADRGATVVAVDRDRDRGEAVEREAADAPGTVRFRRADLAEAATVRELAAEFEAEYDRLDVLAHNAGLSVSERTLTADGIETTFAVNHLAPYLLTHELLDALRSSRPARVVVTASAIHARGTLDFDDLGFESGYDAVDAYARSKLANVAFTIELGDRLGEGIAANCFHPGFVPSTDLFRNAAPWTRAALGLASALPGVGTSEAEGARRLVRLATAPRFGETTGTYVTGEGVETPAAAARDPAVRERLWEVSADLVGVDPDWP